VASDSSAANWTAVTKLAQDTDAAVARLELLALRANQDARERAWSRRPVVARISRLFAADDTKCVSELPRAGMAASGTDLATDGPAVRHSAGCNAQRAFRSRHFDVLEAMLTPGPAGANDLPDGESQVRGVSSGLDDLFEYGGLSVENAFAITADWRRVIPGSKRSYLVEAMILRDWAWSARGHGGADSISPQVWTLFAHRTAMAAKALQDAEGSAPTTPMWFDLALSIGLDQSMERDKLRDLVDRGSRAFPLYLPIYRQMLRALMPRWGGSFDEVQKFILDVSGRAGTPDGLELYSRLHWAYANIEGDDVDAFHETHADWRAMQEGFASLIERHPGSDVLLNAFANSACRTRDADVYLRLRPRLEGHRSSTAWTDRFSIAQCDWDLLAHSRANSAMPGAAAESATQRYGIETILSPEDRGALKSQIASALIAAEPLRQAVSKYIADKHRYPEPNAAAASPELHTIQAPGATVALGVGGSVNVVLRGGPLDGRDFAWVPLSREGVVKWECAKGRVPAEYFGDNCR
jgi:hypothetical protein